MNFDDIKNRFVGVWTGKSVLHLSWMTPPEYHSASGLTATAAIRDKFLTFNYTWEHEDKAQEGLLLLGYDAEKKIVNAAWVDSWHSGVKPLILSGIVDEQAKVDLRGTFEVPNHPDWGWRIVLSTTDNNFEIVMYNISPEGVEYLAVQSDYEKMSH